MSNLPGNPHAENVEVVLMQTVLSSDDSGTQTIESLLMDNATATLALAYEQRLATLATLFNTPDNSAIPGVDYAEAARQLSEGLGMRAEK